MNKLVLKRKTIQYNYDHNLNFNYNENNWKNNGNNMKPVGKKMLLILITRRRLCE